MDEDEMYEFIGLRAEDERARGGPAVAHAPIEDDNVEIVVTDVVSERARPNKGDLLVQLMNPLSPSTSPSPAAAAGSQLAPRAETEAAAPPPARRRRQEMSTNPDGGRSFARRDLLLKIQSDVQKCWEESKRLRGSNVLLPFAFHCTGMPIKASADKLSREMQQYGYPPVFPELEDDSSAEVAGGSQADHAASVVPDKFKSKKSKAASKEDLKAFGLGCDWRRSFITTDMNPFYDAFVRWQMRKLKKMGKVVKDMRYTIYCPLDGQPCADHDRASESIEGPRKTNLLRKLSGSDLIGLPLKSPLAFNEIIYALPMLTILTDKGTGIVTSVPSDSPDDFMALQDLVTKPALRQKYGVKNEWVLPFKVVPIINIPGFGDKSAEKVCLDLKIKSQNDKEKLAEAKRMTYLKGFTDGTMIVGEFNGRNVQEAKPLIKNKLLEDVTAVLYSEPEKKVMSRSGDERVVALTDQCIYNHTALLPEHHWPRGFRCNGHLMLNSEKMSKSTGNFRTLRQAIEEFSFDATRFALADAGDGMDDANFVFETENAASLRLMKEIAWMEEVIAAESSLRAGPPSTYADHVFANEINIAVIETEKSYNAFMFRDALKLGFYDLQLARDEYRLSCGAAGMNRALLWRFMEVQTRLITPICPHYAEHVWQNILRKEGFAIKAGWPIAGTPDPTLRIANKYLQDSIVKFRKLLQKQESGSKKPKKGTASPPSEENKLLETNFKQVQKLCMPFIKSKKDEARSVGPHALNLKLPFGEMSVLEDNLELIKRQVGLEHAEVLSASDEAARAKAGVHASILDKTPPSPGEPVAIFMSKLDFEAWR
ncbi:hypothetical protein E2562_037719 [Oryza meyeriana var. granulata]|uniref:leucine--tRNA ligase n=1 Tax=Oryza meyeriana var. granulata TaxID=110450 RepID=A0A6G1DT14_9ORYZ|nr:hypothetical protein E2562_037719 [Oryza meyeriana var. granulata]